MPSWLQRPGEQDITSHVDFTSAREAAEAAGLTTIGFLDQTYFLLGLVDNAAAERPFDDLKDRLALKTLVMPGGLGSTHKVLIWGRTWARRHCVAVRQCPRDLRTILPLCPWCPWCPWC